MSYTSWLFDVNKHQKGDVSKITGDYENGYRAETMHDSGNCDNAHFCDLSDTIKKIAEKWIIFNVCTAKTANKKHTSYGMKHTLQRRTNIYMTNNQFKELMINCGFAPHDPRNNINWNFYIAESSPIFKRQNDGEYGLPLIGDPDWYKKG